GGGTVADPLPQLGSSDLGGRGVFHQVVDGNRTRASQPGREVLQCNAEVSSQAGFRNATSGDTNIDQLLPGDLDVVPLTILLVRLSLQYRIEHVSHDRYQVRMCHPGAIIT